MTLCQCGCGNPTPLASYSHAARGYVRGEPMRYLPGHKARAGHRVEERGYKTPCWIWEGKRDADGYGRLVVGGRQTTAHRFAYERDVGPIPAAHDLHHKCGVRDCVNPGHLEPLLPSTHSRKQTHLTDDDRSAIQRSQDTQRALAARYGVGKTTIARIKRDV